MHRRFRLREAWTGMVLLLMVCAAAQDGQVLTPNAVATKMSQGGSTNSIKPTTFDVNASFQGQQFTAQHSGPVDEILKMADAGVSKEVIKSYIENTRFDFVPTAADMIALKQHAVTDDITTALLKRSAEIRQQKSQMNPALALHSDLSYGPLDPESYNYFQYYYLYPRTLAYAYEKLGGCYAQGFPGNCFPFRPGDGYSPHFVRSGDGVHFHP